MDALVAWVNKAGGQVGVAVMDVETGRLLASVQERRGLNPASNAKLLTAAVALKKLGPDYRYTTGIYGHLRDGAMTDLVLRGHGDPSLTVGDLSSMCRSLVAMGLKRIDGKILVDQSWFDHQFVPPEFAQQPQEWASFRAPVSAVAIERNTITMNVVALEAEQSATVWFHPPGFVTVRGSVQTGKVGSGQDVRLALQPAGGRLQATIGGRVAAGLPRLRYARRVDDPRLYPGYVLRFLLDSLGVKVNAKVAAGGEAARTRIVWHRSAPLGLLLPELGKHSDNFYAEMVFKTLGAESAGKPAHSSTGAKVVMDWLRQIGAADANTVVKNGSGLFDANRLSPLSLTRALRAAYRDPAIRPEFVGQLAVGGVDGTLRSRFRRHRATRVVRAKTGTLAKVDALAGYVMDQGGRPPIAFAIIVAGIRQHPQARQQIDRVVEQIVAQARPAAQ